MSKGSGDGTGESASDPIQTSTKLSSRKPTPTSRSEGAQIVSFATGRERIELQRKEQKAEAMREAFRLARGETGRKMPKLASTNKKRRNKKKPKK